MKAVFRSPAQDEPGRPRPGLHDGGRVKQVAIDALSVLAAYAGWLGCWLLTITAIGLPMFIVMTAFDRDYEPSNVFNSLFGLVMVYPATMLYVYFRQAVRRS